MHTDSALRRKLASTVAALNAGLDKLTFGASLLILPLGALLCAQWPLRDVIGAGSRPANDIAQWTFALYVAFALRHTTRVRGHMAADALAARYPARVREAIQRWGQALCVLPWAGFVLVSGASMAWSSLRGLEAFPDTFNPLYFIIKGSGWLLALLMALQALLDLLQPGPVARR
jgi:TRAP-type C4-dicarboxylate transport system permease small subunit